METRFLPCPDSGSCPDLYVGLSSAGQLFSVDEITWVVTSYLVAVGITIPMMGWIAARFGRKRYFMASIVTFIAASAMCGVAQRDLRSVATVDH